MKKSPTLSSKDFLENQVRYALDYALSKGATSAAAEVQDQNGLNINVRNLDVETLEHTRDRSFAITVYINQRRGSASTGDLTRESIEQTVRAAVDIANYTSEDPCAGYRKKICYVLSLKTFLYGIRGRFPLKRRSKSARLQKRRL